MLGRGKVSCILTQGIAKSAQRTRDIDSGLRGHLVDEPPARKSGMMEKMELPCCGLVEVQRMRELPHVYGFDFDLFQCRQCARYWVRAWLTVGGWEAASAEDAKNMMTLRDKELLAYMKQWARSFD